MRKKIETSSLVTSTRVVADGWHEIRLGDVCTKIGSGATPRGGSGVYLDDGQIALIRSQNVYNDGFSRDGLAFITPQHAEELEQVEVMPGDVLLNITGDSVARSCQVDKSILPARVNQHVAIIRPDPQKLDARFLRYILVSPQTQAMMLSWAGSGGTRNALTKGMIESFVITAPRELSQQRAIAKVMGALDDKIELNRRMNETLEAAARNIFKSWFVDFDPVHAKAEGHQPSGIDAATAALFPNSFEDSPLGKVPNTWSIRTIKQLCEIGRGASPRPIHDFMNGEIPWIKIADATASSGPFIYQTAEHVTKDGAARSIRVEPGDLILSNSATCGVPVFVDIAGYIHDGWLYFRNLKHISKIYLYFALKEISNYLVHIADGSVQKNLNTQLVGGQRIVVPDCRTAEAFESIAAPIFDLIRRNGLQSRMLAGFRDTLLPKLISGEIRVSAAGKLVETMA